MKAQNFVCRIVILFLGISSINNTQICGQVQKDPLTGIYKTGGASELLMNFTNSDYTESAMGIMQVPEDLSDIISDSTQYKREYLYHFKTASAVGDFNGDGADEVVTITKNAEGKIKITIPVIRRDLKMSYYLDYSDEKLDSCNYERLRICSGNFDDDPEDEFAICYGKTNDFLTISIYETDANLNINFLASYNEIFYHSKIFDIGSGDIDGDGYDELVLVNNINLPEWKEGTAPAVFISDYTLNVLEYNIESEAIELSISDRIKLESAATSYWFSTGRGGSGICDIRVSCGDIDGDITDEIAIAWSNYYSHASYDPCGTCSREYYYRSLLFLHTFESNQNGDGFDVIANNLVSYDDYSQLNLGSGHHIALSLKCLNLDNVGCDEIVVATSQHLSVLAYDNYYDTVYKKGEIYVADEYIDIRGNETFAVADFNPDTANLEFRKEIILLKSNNSCIEQLRDNPSCKTQFETYKLNNTGNDTITFNLVGSLHSIPFNNSDNVIINTFTAGDFNLANSEIYYIGEPDIFNVKDLEQPIVILNAPPVHFDVLNGETHDLCNAFGNNNPPFYASYKTEINNKTTTKVAVSSACGFSSDLRKYVMIGGNGFQKKVTKNHNEGKSFYEAIGQNSSIEETKNAYTEDYVLYSTLNYSYFLYPVYNSEWEKAGDICVLNPKSQQMVTSWGSGNSWVNPGYVFNHEPGNILSYKNYIDSSDFVTGPSEFTSCYFSEVPVSHTGDGSFKFTFDKITTEGDSLSYSYGGGTDKFTKVGFEGTVTAGIDLKVFSVSRSVDYKIGMSSNISRNYSGSNLKTHRTTLENTFQVDGVIGRLNPEYDLNARYKIKPFIYRSQSGALVLDYVVDIDDNNRDWWDENYGQKPDLAFILPWRYASEKGAVDVKRSKKQQTNDIQFINPVASPGDTVCITTRVHNYSLKEFDGRIRIQLYLGDPELDGVLLEDIYGNTEISKNVIMRFEAKEVELDNEEYFTFNWKVPDTISCSPRIYAVIDPDNEFEEIHKNNNIGWNKMLIADCDECNYPEQSSGVKNPWMTVENKLNLDVYPNPATSACIIHFDLTDNETVNIDLYSLSGMMLRNIAYDNYAAGEHSINIDTGQLEEGIYLIKVTANKETSLTKLVISD